MILPVFELWSGLERTASSMSQGDIQYKNFQKSDEPYEECIFGRIYHTVDEFPTMLVIRLGVMCEKTTNNPVDPDFKDGINVIHWTAMVCWILIVFWLGNKPEAFGRS